MFYLYCNLYCLYCNLMILLQFNKLIKCYRTLNNYNFLKIKKNYYL